MCKLYWQEDSFKRNSRAHFFNFVWRDFLVNKDRTEHDNLHDTLNCISGHPANFATCIAWIRKQFCLIRIQDNLDKCVMYRYSYVYYRCVSLYMLHRYTHTVCFCYKKNEVRMRWLQENRCWNNFVGLFSVLRGIHYLWLMPTKWRLLWQTKIHL